MIPRVKRTPMRVRISDHGNLVLQDSHANYHHMMKGSFEVSYSSTDEDGSHWYMCTDGSGGLFHETELEEVEPNG
jgi:hypothetical protein